MPLTDEELGNALLDYARRFTARCSFERAAQMLMNDEDERERHGEPADEGGYELEAGALYEDEGDAGPYVVMLFSVIDRRAKRSGGTWSPLCCEANIHADGRVELGPVGKRAPQ